MWVSDAMNVRRVLSIVCLTPLRRHQTAPDYNRPSVPATTDEQFLLKLLLSVSKQPIHKKQLRLSAIRTPRKAENHIPTDTYALSTKVQAAIAKAHRTSNHTVSPPYPHPIPLTRNTCSTQRHGDDNLTNDTTTNSDTLAHLGTRKPILANVVQQKRAGA